MCVTYECEYMVSEKINGARNPSCASSPHINLNIMYGPFVD